MIEVTRDFASGGGWHCKTHILSGDIDFSDGNISLTIALQEDSLLGLPLNQNHELVGCLGLSGKLKVDKYRTYYNLLPPFRQIVNTGRKKNRRFDEIYKKEAIVFPTSGIYGWLSDYFALLYNDVRFKGCPWTSEIPIHQLINDFEPTLKNFQEEFIRKIQTPRYHSRFGH